MIGLDCLRHAPELIGALQKKVEAIMHGMLADGKPIPFMEVYKELIKSIEIGIEDASKVYLAAANAVKVEYSDKIDDVITTQDDLDKLVRGDVDKLLNEIGKKRDPKTGSIRYQRENVATNLAKSIIGLVNNKEYPVANSQTIAAQIRNNVRRYAESILGKVNEGTTPTNALKEAIEKQLLDPSATSFGTLNQEALWDALKPAIDSIVEQIKDPAVKEKFRNEVRKIKEAAFNLGITQTKRKQILYDLIAKEDRYTSRVGTKKLQAERDLKLMEDPSKRKEIEDWYAKEYEKLKRIPNWNAIAKAGDMEEVLDKVLGDELKNLGVTDPSLKSKIYNALIDEYNELKRAATLQRALQLNAKNRVQLIDEVAMQNGFFRWAGSKRVPDYSAKTGDRKWLKFSLLQGGYLKEAAALNDKTSAKDIEKYISDVVGKWIDNKNFEQVAEATRRLMHLNNKEFQDKVRKIDRIGRYREAGIGLDHITDGIAGNVLGLRIKPEYMAELAAIADMRNELEETPNKLYDRMKLDPKLRDRLPQQYNMSRFARIAHEELTRRTSRLIARTIRNDHWRSLAGIIEGFKKWKRMILTAILTNPINVPQNLFYNQFRLISSLPKFSPKALYELEKEYFSNLWSVLMGDPLGTEEQIRKSEDISSIYHYDSLIWKIYGGIKQYSEGLITALDAAAQTIIDRNNMFETITREIGLKTGKNKAEYNKILDEYRYLSSSHVAMELAKQYLKSVGITDARRPKAYQRILAREAKNIEMGFFMGERFGEYINADRILTYSGTQKKLTRQTLGREDQSKFSMADGTLREDVFWNPFTAINKNLDRWEERLQENYLEARNKGKKAAMEQAQWALVAMLNNTLSTGIFPFAAGAFRYVVIGGQSLGFGFINARGRNRKELEELIKTKSPERVSYNENRIKSALHNYEIDRFRAQLAISGVVGLAVFASLMLATADDDDGDEWYEKIVNQTFDVMQGHPYVRALLTRVAPAWVRAIAGYAEADKKVKMGKPLTTEKKVLEGLSNVVGMRTPLTPTAVFEKFERHPTAEIGRTLSTQIGVGNLLWPISFYNTVEDEMRGFRKQVSVDSNPFIRELTDGEFINGIFWGLAGYGPSYKVEGRNVPITELNLIGKDWPKEIPYKEMLGDIKGQDFKDIPWAKYGRPDLELRKKEINKAYERLPEIKERIYELSKEIGDGFVLKSDLDAVWERPTRGFIVDIINGDIDEVEKELGVKRTESGRINMLAAAMKKMTLNDLTITDIENALLFKNLQEKQLP